MSRSTNAAIVQAIEEAEEITIEEGAPSDIDKPKLLIENCDPDRTVAALRDILVEKNVLYDRGVPVRIVFDRMQTGSVAQIMTADAMVMLAHSVCRPFQLKTKQDGTTVETNARLPRSLAVMYLDWRGEWRLPVLNGIASAPLLRNDGTILSADGYDAKTGIWRENVPDLFGRVPNHPTLDQAMAALRLVRETFRTFCFADAALATVESDVLPMVDTALPPGKDESAFLAALLTAICRPSLSLAPGLLLRAAPMSGAGAGKGLLARCICIIAFGRDPHAVTGGATVDEMDKRIAAELIEGSPVLFLDNLNNISFRSNLLASAITERPARVRVLGRSQMAQLNAAAFIIMTGNGLSVSEDLARRFLTVELDPRTEDPESRKFSTDIRKVVISQRRDLLSAMLTIWRWGRQNPNIVKGRPLGSFEQWCAWVRDPLIALGCQDPVERVAESKERDGGRQVIAEIFATWRKRHGDRPIAVRDLSDDVKAAIDTQGRGRQYVSSRLEKLTGTRMIGLIMTRQAPAGKWGVATYALVSTDSSVWHRGHRGDGTETTKSPASADHTCHAEPECMEPNNHPMPPMSPMSFDAKANQPIENEEPRAWKMRL